MALLESKKDTLCLTINNEILIFNVRTKKHNVYKICKKVQAVDKVQVTQKYQDINVDHIVMSADAKILAVTTDDKQLIIFKSVGDKDSTLFELSGSTLLQRRSSAMIFDNNSSRLAIADKTGDVYLSEELEKWEPHMLLGHLSMLRDVIFSHDSKFIITCDRDEKIRTSIFPNTYDIHSYCLGHEEFVSGLVLLPQDPKILLSCSGDATLRAWDYQCGIELMCVLLPKAATAIKICSCGDTSHVAVSLYESNDLHIYEIGLDDSSTLTCKLFQVIGIEHAVVTFVFCDANLWISVMDDKPIIIYSFDLVTNVYVKDNISTYEPVNTLSKKLVSKDVMKPDEFVSTLFKKHYNNVEEYHCKKKIRLESKNETSVV